MDGARFDTLARSLTSGGSRRRALAITLGGVIGALGLATTEAKKKKKKACPPCKKRKQGKGKGKKADGTGCEGGTCQDGRCIPLAQAALPPPSPPADPAPLCVEATCCSCTGGLPRSATPTSLMWTSAWTRSMTGIPAFLSIRSR